MDKNTCAVVIKELWINYIAFTESIVNIIIYQILKNEENNFPKTKMLMLDMKFDTSIYHNKFPFLYYWSPLKNLLLPLEITNKNLRQDSVFEYNELLEVKKV